MEKDSWLEIEVKAQGWKRAILGTILGGALQLDGKGTVVEGESVGINGKRSIGWARQKVHWLKGIGWAWHGICRRCRRQPRGRAGRKVSEIERKRGKGSKGTGLRGNFTHQVVHKNMAPDHFPLLSLAVAAHSLSFVVR